MADPMSNGHDSLEGRVLILERDSGKILAAQRVILGRIADGQEADNARHGEAMRVIDGLVGIANGLRSEVRELAAAVETLMGRVPEKRIRKRRAKR